MEAEEVKVLDLEKYTGPSFSETLHEDLVFLILSYCDIETMTLASNSNKFWRQLMKKESKHRFKTFCLETWQDTSIYSATNEFTKSFGSWRNMYIYRPRIKIDGIYSAKVMYWHRG